jgi:small GTP-binding protein
MSSPSPDKLKVVLLGESGVGKTSIISQFISGKFDSDCISSLSAQYISKTVDFNDINKSIKFDIWDTAGQEKFRALAKIFYRDAKVICLCYDISSEKSFIELKDYWYEQQVKLFSEGDPIYAVVANKSDLYAKSEVPDEKGKAFAKEINGIFQSTSAKSNSGINILFNNIGHKYFDPNFDTNAKESKEKQEYEKKKSQKQQQKTQQLPQTRGVKLDSNKAKPQKKGGCC